LNNIYTYISKNKIEELENKILDLEGGQILQNKDIKILNMTHKNDINNLISQYQLIINQYELINDILSKKKLEKIENKILNLEDSNKEIRIDVNNLMNKNKVD